MLPQRPRATSQCRGPNDVNGKHRMYLAIEQNDPVLSGMTAATARGARPRISSTLTPPVIAKARKQGPSSWLPSPCAGSCQRHCQLAECRRLSRRQKCHQGSGGASARLIEFVIDPCHLVETRPLPLQVGDGMSQRAGNTQQKTKRCLDKSTHLQRFIFLATNPKAQIRIYKVGAPLPV